MASNSRILQNIVVRKGDKRGRFFVTASDRRLAALNLLAEAGQIGNDYPIECKERSGVDATENTSSEAMHPVEEYEAFRVLADGGKPVEDIAAALARPKPRRASVWRSLASRLSC
ncbi:hypothetical protein ACDY96_23760 [Rhizobium mongolense]|uniref:hypothetical protein n=1 Tax=Rhizobium mongolense TaxID=57676 RepID=UPI00355804C4